MDRAALTRITEIYRRPFVAVLDTSCVRSGLDRQLKYGTLPASLSATRDGTTRLFMERETLNETHEKLPVFAEQFGIPASDVVTMFAKDWLPYISVVALPPWLRAIDPRATAVQDLDPDDYPTAALAALLSPCVLLTHNYKHFRPLGIHDPSQGVKAAIATIHIENGEIHLNAVSAVPAVPVVGIYSGAEWMTDRFGTAGWIVLGLLAAGGIVAYRQQPPERKAAIKKTAGRMALSLLEEHARATSSVRQARELLGDCVVPAPQSRTAAAAMFRELAMASDSMSAQQLYDVLGDSTRPQIGTLRAFLHGNKAAIFGEARRGSFVLGKRYVISQN